MCHASCKSTNFSTTPPIFEAKASPPRELWSFPQAFLFFAFKFPWVLRPDGAAGLAVFRAAIKATEGNGNHPPFGGFGGDKTISTDVSFGGLWFSSWQLFFWFGTKKSKESFFWIWLPCFWRRCCFCNRFHSAKMICLKADTGPWFLDVHGTPWKTLNPNNFKISLERWLLRPKGSYYSLGLQIVFEGAIYLAAICECLFLDIPNP